MHFGQDPKSGINIFTHKIYKSPLLEVEVVLISFVFTAHRLCCPMAVGDTIALMNALISGTSHKTRLIAWKKTHSWYNTDSTLVGYKWFQNFCKRNPELRTKKLQKYARNREDYCNYAAFVKMYTQCEDGLVASGNAVRYEHPVHNDANGKIVDNVSLAFGNLVTINYVRPENVFFLDETVDNTHGNDDRNQAARGKLFQEAKFPKSLLE